MKFLDLNGLKRVIDKILLKVQPYIYRLSANNGNVSFKTTHQIVLIEHNYRTIDTSLWFGAAPLGSMLEFIFVEKLPRCNIICYNTDYTASVLTKFKTTNNIATPTNINSLTMTGKSYVRIMKYSDSQALVINDMDNKE